MKVSEASDDKLNRFIARVFEAEPMIGSVPTATEVWQWRGVIVSYSWQPIDFCRSGDGLKMMLERIILQPPAHIGVTISNYGIALTDDRNDPGESIHNIFRETPDGWFRRFGFERGIQRVFSEAFAIANGWKE